MLIAILSVKLKVKGYVHISKMADKYWDINAKYMELTLISEKQLRVRLKKSVISMETQQRSFICYFPVLEIGDDERGQRSGLAQKTEGSEHNAQGTAWHR